MGYHKLDRLGQISHSAGWTAWPVGDEDGSLLSPASSPSPVLRSPFFVLLFCLVLLFPVVLFFLLFFLFLFFLFRLFFFVAPLFLVLLLYFVLFLLLFPRSRS